MFRGRVLFVFCGVLATAGAWGCRRPAAAPQASSGTAVKPIASRGFTPPADGLLTEADLDLYVKVRRAAKGRPDGDAARAVGVDPDRFAWIQARIIEALVSLDARRVSEAAAETYTKTLASLRESRRAVRDPAAAKTLEVRIAQLERERAQMRRAEELTPRLAANRRRVGARHAELAAAAGP